MAMKPRGQDVMRPSTPPPATSWWTKPMDRAQFDAEAAKQRARMNAVTVAYNKPQKRAHDE